MEKTIDNIVTCIETALGFELFDWQKDFLFKDNWVTPCGRQTGRTTAYMLKLLLSEGPPIHMYDLIVLSNFVDEDFSFQYSKYFRENLQKMYIKLTNPKLHLKIRKIYFTEKDYFLDKKGVENNVM